MNPLTLEGDGDAGGEEFVAGGGSGKNIVLSGLGSVVDVALGRGASSNGLQFCPYGLRFVDGRCVLSYEKGGKKLVRDGKEG